MRSSLALIATVGLAVALTGCTAAGSTPEATTGASVEAVTVTGDFGAQPTVSFPTPLTPTETQCEVLVEGEGPTIASGQLVEAAFTAYDGGTGERLGSSGFDETGGVPLVRDGAQSNSAFNKALSCANEGSRVVVAAADYDAFGNGAPEEGAAPTEGVVIVLDVLRAFPTKAWGQPQLTRDGFPAVVLAPDGRPGITVPKADPPRDARETSAVEVLKAGDGQVVEEGDTVIVQYTGVTWADNSLVPNLSTWEHNQPTGVAATSDVTQTSVLPVGATKSLIGQKVGSQIGVIVPAAETGSGSGSAPSDQTLFFVVDILGVV